MASVTAGQVHPFVAPEGGVLGRHHGGGNQSRLRQRGPARPSAAGGPEHPVSPLDGGAPRKRPAGERFGVRQHASDSKPLGGRLQLHQTLCLEVKDSHTAERALDLRVSGLGDIGSKGLEDRSEGNGLRLDPQQLVCVHGQAKRRSAQLNHAPGCAIRHRDRPLSLQREGREGSGGDKRVFDDSVAKDACEPTGSQVCTVQGDRRVSGQRSHRHRSLQHRPEPAVGAPRERRPGALEGEHGQERARERSKERIRAQTKRECIEVHGHAEKGARGPRRLARRSLGTLHRPQVDPDLFEADPRCGQQGERHAPEGHTGSRCV